MNDKSVTSFGNTTVAQTAHEIDLKVGPDIKIPPEVTFKDVKNETVLVTRTTCTSQPATSICPI